MTDHEHPGSDSERFWEDRYRGDEGPGPVHGSGPNPVLTDIAGPLSPATALDLGCGRGGDALWLAGRGWRVTAVDVSVTALTRAAARAAEAGVGDRIDWQQHDLARTFPAAVFDLVSAQYFQTPVEGFSRTAVLQRAARAVAPGGLLLVVDHGSVPPWSWAHPDAEFPTAGELLAALDLAEDRWQPEVLGSPERLGTGPGGQSARVVDTVVAVRRRTP